MSSFLKHLLIATLLVILSQQAFTSTLDLQRAERNPHVAQNEIRHVGLLLIDNGKAEEIGYMKLPLRVLNENSLQSSQTPRFKKWDIHDVISDDFYHSVSISNLGSIGLVRSVIFDYNTGKSEVVAKTLSGDEVPELSHTSYRYSNGTGQDISLDNSVNFKVENIEGESYTGFFARNIKSSSDSYELNVNINVTFDQEGIAAVIPLDKNRQQFVYEINSGNLPAEGTLKYNGKEYTLNHENGAAGHTYVRGIWSDSNFLIRARGQGVLEDGRKISLFLNSGYGHPEANEATTDAFVVDRFSYKLNAVDAELNEQDLTQPIKFKSVFNGKKDFKECHVTFTPALVDKHTVSEATISGTNDILVGTFSGYVTDYKNKRYSFDTLRGAVEIIKLSLTDN